MLLLPLVLASVLLSLKCKDGSALVVSGMRDYMLMKLRG